jgi:hypothetical protein
MAAGADLNGPALLQALDGMRDPTHGFASVEKMRTDVEIAACGGISDVELRADDLRGGLPSFSYLFTIMVGVLEEFNRYLPSAAHFFMRAMFS